MAKSNLTPKQRVLIADPLMMLDYYEALRCAGKPCWFIRKGIQGPAYSGICTSPRAAWKDAYDSLLAAIKLAGDVRCFSASIRKAVA
jgi:hypothetical protein